VISDRTVVNDPALLTPSSEEVTIPRPRSLILQEYLGRADDPFAGLDFTESYSETIDQKFLPSPALHLDATHLFDNALNGAIGMPPLSYGSSLSSTLASDSYLAAPTTPMSRNPSGSNQLAESLDMFRMESQEGNYGYPAFQSSDQDELRIMAGMGQVMEFEYLSDQITLPAKRAAEISSVELHRQEVEKPINIHGSRSKRPSPDLAKQSSHPAKSNKTSATRSPTKANKPYVRPKHPRVHCRQCPADHKGFRGEHEYNRHFERKHAVHKKTWVVRDMSGTGLLSKCKACSGGRKYGVDYNATAHLKRQHFNPAKNSEVKVPENIRDWIEEVEGGQDDRKRGTHGKSKESETSKDEENGSDSPDDEEEEVTECLEMRTRQKRRAGTETFDLEAAQIKKPVQAYIQQMEDERQQKLFKEAAKCSADALHEVSGESWQNPNETIANYSRRAEESGGTSRQITRHEARCGSVTAFLPEKSSWDVYDYQQLLRVHDLTTQIAVGFDCSTVSPTDLFWDDGLS
jgi:hypothetical protein